MPVLPDHTQPLLDERPPLRLGRLTRIFALAAGPLIRRIGARRVRRGEQCLKVLLSEAGKCRDRDQLVGLLGTPRYAMSGKHFGFQAPKQDWIRPDRVECYEKNRCLIEIWFRNDNIMQMTGAVKPSIWEIEIALRERGAAQHDRGH